jgi:hypothetical protein
MYAMWQFDGFMKSWRIQAKFSNGEFLEKLADFRQTHTWQVLRIVGGFPDKLGDWSQTRTWQVLKKNGEF